MSDRRADDPSVTVRLRPELVARMDAACRARCVGRRLLVEEAVERLLDALESVPITSPLLHYTLRGDRARERLAIPPEGHRD